MTIFIAVAHHDNSTCHALNNFIMLQTGCKCIWSGTNISEVIQHYREQKPDILLLDVSLSPNGCINEVMKTCPCAIILLTDSIESHANIVFEALGNGALDAVRLFKEKTGEVKGENELAKKIGTISKLLNKPRKQKVPRYAMVQSCNRFPPLIAIGASTGGPHALSVILSKFPVNPGAAIVIIQHMDREFSIDMVKWINGQCSINVVVAREGDRLRQDVVLVASTNDHLVLGDDLALHYTVAPNNYPFRPSVDVFFKSLVKFWPRRDMAVLLTGMGRDGGSGMSALRKTGWYTIAQDEKTCVVYGMPAAAVKLDGASKILPLEEIAPAILRRLKENECKG